MNVAVVRAPGYEPASVQGALLRAFDALGMPGDNPLSGLVKPGDRVFIKPNWVAHRYRASCPCQDDLYSTITHPQVILGVVELVARALDGRGHISIGDNPSIDANFEALMDAADFASQLSQCAVPCELLDLRPLVCRDLKDYGLKHRMQHQRGDPRGSTTLDLGKRSFLNGVNPRLFRGVFSDRRDTIALHSGGHHVYEFSNSIWQADVFISVPKLKTHHKVGTTLNIKGLVGTVANKDGLVHWRQGFPLLGGDEYPTAWQWLKSRFTKLHKRGAWSGNDTTWRMVADLYTALEQHGPRRTFSVVDGIVGGEGDGPFCPRAKRAQTLIVGGNLLEVDCVASHLMGFDLRNIRYLECLLRAHGRNVRDIRVHQEVPTEDFWSPSYRGLDFVPPSGWQSLSR